MICRNKLQTSALVIVFAVSAGVVSAQTVSVRKPLPQSVLPVLGQAQAAGPSSGSDAVHLTVSLRPLHEAELQAYCDSVSDPSSPNYGRYLTPQQVGERFGASAAEQKAVVDYLASKGITVTLVAPNRMAVLAEATVSQVQAAFGTTVKEFNGPAPEGFGQVHFRSNATPLTLPTNIASTVIDVSGIETYSRPKARATTTTLTPTLTRALYNTAPLYSALFQGQGRTIGISNWDGFRLTNAKKYISKYNLPVPAGGATSNIVTIKIDGGSGSGNAGGEGDLDIQMVLGTAPLANIRIYDGGASLVNVLTREATDNLADIITESYGWNISAATATAAHNQHLAMTAQGITYMAASGDSGTSLEPYSYPNYEPEVLQVGGTVATVDSTTGARVGEVGWSGSGGGWSTNTASFNTLPSWQHGTGVPTTINKRLCPDVSLHASGSGAGAYYFYFRNSLTGGYVGTSFACPVFAGCLGIAEQKLIALGKLPSFGGKLRFGRIQDLFYSQNGRSDVWHDITSGGNGNLPNGSASTCTVAWDSVTGWGSIDFNAFVNSIP